MSADENLQRAIYSKLTGNSPLMALIEGVYADVQQPDDAGSDTPFPYVTIGQSTLNRFDTKTSDGINALCQIDIWSRANNYTQAKAIGAAIRDALHHQDLTITGASHIITLVESAEYTPDPDGHTKRGLLLVRVMFDDI